MIRRIIAALLVSVALIGVATAQEDPHAAHRKAMENTAKNVSVHSYELDNLAATTMQAARTDLLSTMDTGNAVLLNFIFTSCTTICPVQTATFAHVQTLLGDDVTNVTMISVSIDPEYDSPERLVEYAEQFRSGPQWQFLTGSNDEMIVIQRAFDAYMGSKMSHQPLVLIRGADHDDWVRIDGMASAKQIISEYRKLGSADKG